MIDQLRGPIIACLTVLQGHCDGHWNHLRCVLDAESHANSTNVHKLLRCWLWGKSARHFGADLLTGIDRTLYHLRYFVSLHLACRPTTAMTIYFFPQRRRRWALTNCPCHGRSPGWKLMSLLISTSPICVGWLHLSHSSCHFHSYEFYPLDLIFCCFPKHCALEHFFFSSCRVYCNFHY